MLIGGLKQVVLVWKASPESTPTISTRLFKRRRSWTTSSRCAGAQRRDFFVSIFPAIYLFVCFYQFRNSLGKRLQPLDSDKSGCLQFRDGPTCSRNCKL